MRKIKFWARTGIELAIYLVTARRGCLVGLVKLRDKTEKIISSLWTSPRAKLLLRPKNRSPFGARCSLLHNERRSEQNSLSAANHSVVDQGRRNAGSPEACKSETGNIVSDAGSIPAASRLIHAVAILLIATTLSCGFQGCAKAIVAKSNKSELASFDPKDKGKPTSGIVDLWRDDKGRVIGRIVTAHYRARYNSLVDQYGDFFQPALKHDEGFDFSREGDTCAIYTAYHIKFGQMQAWKRDGRVPTSGWQKLIKKVTG